jgi:protein-L-isoaspartate(D-aspartate) O-methyltransferase
MSRRAGAGWHAVWIVGAALFAAALPAPAADRDAWAEARERMVRDDIEAGGITDPRVLASMRTTPRHEFVPAAWRPQAYLDMALPIGAAQTISGPFVVASMTAELRPQPTDRVLEIGTGSGYQAAVLAPLVKTVYSIEIEGELAAKASRTLRRLGYRTIVTKVGDGFAGWPEHAPFDGIIVTCSPEDVPQPLLDQLAEGGRMIIPVGERFDQRLVRITKRDGELVRETLVPTLFVPMTGAAEDSRRVRPDGGRPTIHNGGFEELVEGSAVPAAWYYGRQVEAASGEAAAGTRWLRLRNTEPGRPAQIFQGFAIDGSLVPAITIRLSIRGAAIVAGRRDDEQPSLVVKFLDGERRRSAVVRLGGWSGSFPWREVEETVSVPEWAREASLMIGMLGATGTFDVDALSVEAKPR